MDNLVTYYSVIPATASSKDTEAARVAEQLINHPDSKSHRQRIELRQRQYFRATGREPTSEMLTRWTREEFKLP